jgi:NDP-sugar pyrophosphorylase family protein
MNAMVLGAGKGTRLARLGLNVPKILVDVGGEPLLARQLRYLGRLGIERVVVNAHHLAEQVEDFAREHIGAPELVVVREPQLLGTAGGVRNALEQLGDEPFLVLYGDVLLDFSLEVPRRARATITVYESMHVAGKGTVEVDADDMVLRFREKEDVAPPALINAGIYLLDPSFVRDHVPPGASDFGHDVFPAALAAGERIGVVRLPQPVLDVGTPEDLARAQMTSS